ncbi:MAG: signal peptidase I [Candidatus Wildermuthbacteria bacterium]|nr:signal peptidase I [Candidatus Wildermuthbacteria bacterium]
MRKTISFLWELAKIGVVAALIVVPLRMYVFQPFLVKGDSMVPNFHNGDYLIVDELSYKFRSPERGEVIVLKFPYDPSQRFIKRIVGLPGETIEIQDGKVVVYQIDTKEAFVLEETEYLGAVKTPGSVKVQLKEGEYFVLGDNREFSSDSRSWGPLARQYIVGKMMWQVFSLDTLASLVNSK